MINKMHLGIDDTMQRKVAKISAAFLDILLYKYFRGRQLAFVFTGLPVYQRSSQLPVALRNSQRR